MSATNSQKKINKRKPAIPNGQNMENKRIDKFHKSNLGRILNFLGTIITGLIVAIYLQRKQYKFDLLQQPEQQFQVTQRAQCNET